MNFAVYKSFQCLGLFAALHSGINSASRNPFVVQLPYLIVHQRQCGLNDNSSLIGIHNSRNLINNRLTGRRTSKNDRILIVQNRVDGFHLMFPQFLDIEQLCSSFDVSFDVHKISLLGFCLSLCYNEIKDNVFW